MPTHLPVTWPATGRRTLLSVCLGLGLAATGLLAVAQTTVQVAQTGQSVRVRGTVVAVDANRLTVKDRRGEVVQLLLNDKTEVAEIYPLQMADIATGSFIGAAALPQADGTQKAIAVTVFPEAARGRGEGHRPFDLLPDSTMTNATVATTVLSAAGSGGSRVLQLQYKGGEKKLLVSADTPIVSFRPGDRSLLVPGASVSLAATVTDDKATATRIGAGKNGFVVPY